MRFLSIFFFSFKNDRKETTLIDVFFGLGQQTTEAIEMDPFRLANISWRRGSLGEVLIAFGGSPKGFRKATSECVKGILDLSIFVEVMKFYTRFVILVIVLGFWLRRSCARLFSITAAEWLVKFGAWTMHGFNVFISNWNRNEMNGNCGPRCTTWPPSKCRSYPVPSSLPTTRYCFVLNVLDKAIPIQFILLYSLKYPLRHPSPPPPPSVSKKNCRPFALLHWNNIRVKINTQKSITMQGG